MAFLKTTIKINGEEKDILCLNHKIESAKPSFGAIHHIHIIDRSGSMSGAINYLIDNIKETIKIMRDEDFMSLLWFSGQGQFKTLIKGAQKSESLYKLLDSLKSTVGLTHFSEVLKECRTLIDDLKVICPTFSVTMFTDGCPQEADAPILEQVKLMAGSILAFHTVGYGNYYNKKLLQSMSELSQYGVCFHSSKIEEYLDIFKGNYETIKELAGTPIEVTAPGCDIIYLASKAVKRAKDQLKVTASDKNKNQIFIVAPKGAKVTGVTGKEKAIPTATMKNFLYAYIQQLYYAGEKSTALDLAVKQLRNKQVADLILRAFTLDEINWSQKMLNKFVYSVSERSANEGTCSENYIPAKDAFCLVDLFALLSKDENIRYVPTANYNRIGVKTTDEFNLFTADKEQNYSPFSNFVYNKEKLNMSILFNVKGTVAINPKEAKRVDLPTKIETSLFRNHTIIKDGNLNIELLTLEMPEESYHKLADTLALKDDITELYNNLETLDNGKLRLTLDLTKLPITNQLYAEAGTAEYIHKLASNELMYMMEAKIVNALIKRIEALNTNAVSKTLRSYTADQMAVLEAHGLDKNLNYKGVDNKREKNETDFYFAKTLEFGFKGFSSIPTAEVIQAKCEAKANTIYANLFQFINYLKNQEGINFESVAVKTYDKLNKKLKEIKGDLAHLRGIIAGIKIATTLTGANWFTGAISDGKGTYTYTKDDLTLIIKSGEEKVFF